MLSERSFHFGVSIFLDQYHLSKITIARRERCPSREEKLHPLLSTYEKPITFYGIGDSNHPHNCTSFTFLIILTFTPVFATP
jgi:hypothetical protein